MFCCTPQRESVNCRQGKQAKGHADVTGHALPRLRGGQPLAGLHPLPDMSHFAAELYECCADLPARF